MAEQTLRTWLELDTTRFRAGIDGAKGKVESFDRQLARAKGGIKDAAGTIEGMAQATQGGVAGAVGAVKDFIGLLASNPPLAIFAAVGAAITGLATLAERKAEEAGKKIEELARLETANRRKMEKALGIDTEAQTADEAKRRVGGGAATVETAAAALAAQRQKVIDAQRAANDATELSTMFGSAPTASDVQRVKETQAALAREVELYEAMKRAADDVRDAETRRKELAERLNDEAQQQFTEQQRERGRAAQAEQDRKDKAIKDRAKREARAAEETADESARFGRALKDLGKRRFSSEFDNSADIMARVGGTIGRGIDPRLRAQDLQLQRLEDLKRLQEEHNRRLAEISKNLQGES